MKQARVRALMLGMSLMACGSSASAETIEAVAARHGFAGEILVGRGSGRDAKLLVDRGFGTVTPRGSVAHTAGQRWRIASISKQVTAALLVARAPSALDQPVAIPGRRVARALPTLRALLTHHTDLANPDDTPAAATQMPAFYRSPRPNLAYCLQRPATPATAALPFRYNNCDTIVAASAGAPLRWPVGLAMARPGERGVPGFIGGKPEPVFELGSFGAAGGLLGTARALWAFDQALMDGRIGSPAVRDVLWTAEGQGSYQGLGAWIFTAPLAGCAKPVRIVQRDGEIAGVQTRNFILPDQRLTVIAFTNRSTDDFSFGEVWQQSGFAYELLSAAACTG
ncbi:serine hydrolase domain-containing protein [Novosphingobium sp.]|uniref:serine hydrolase domain-containing protein n=1 Tax=Novosphingobium sp. TaxID=1874826 RepID=UPI002FDC86E0